MQVISIDCGRSALKAVSVNKRLSIKSIVGEPRELKIGDYGDYDVIINGQRHFVGELAERESRFKREMVSQSKIHEDTAILSLTAIALLAEPGESIRVVTGLPVEQHDQQTKMAYAKLLSGNHIITVNGAKKNVRISEDSIAVSVEGGGAYWADSTRGNCYVVDLGSRTVNAVRVQQNRFRDVDSLTLNYGCLELSNASDAPTELIAEQLARRIYADLSRRWLDIKTDTVLLVGGGALLMEQWLKQYYPGARLASDPVWANAMGYHRLGLMKWQSKN